MRRLSYFFFITIRLAAYSPAQNTVSVISGDGPVGTLDPVVSLLAGPEDGGFPSIGPQEFAFARGGAKAYIVTPTSFKWTTQLESSPNSKWICSDPTPGSGNSTLFAVPFVLDPGVICQGGLTLHYAVDNLLGDSGIGIPGIFINEVPVPGPFSGGYWGETTWESGDIGPLLIPGTTNWLYLYAYDYGSDSGIMFGVSIDYGFGSVFCPPTTNSTGAVADISSTGSTSLGSNAFVLQADGVPNSAYVFIKGPCQPPAPFGNGLLCLGAPHVRLNGPSLATQNQALLQVDFTGLGIQPGVHSFQCWYRDSAAGGHGFNTSSALSVALLP